VGPRSAPKSWLRRLGYVGIAILIVALVPVLVVESACRSTGGAPRPVRDPAVAAKVPLDLPGYKRAEAASYLSFPEWYIVQAYEDFAGVLKTGDESAFGYGRSVAGFWLSFCGLNRRVSSAEPTFDMKLMLYTIGVSFTAELGIKGIYEMTLGRLAEWARGPEKTPQDRFASRMADDYARFLRQTPWFEYPFMTKIGELWAEPMAGGRGLVRSLERRIALTMEFGAKAVYGAALRWAAGVAYGEGTPQTMAVLRIPDGVVLADGVKRVSEVAPGVALVSSPRYRLFSDMLVGLARQGGAAVEIAGNTRMLGTALVRQGSPVPGLGPVVFEVPLQSRPGWQRTGFDVDVGGVTEVLHALDAAGGTLEHLYDY
jgi:hypothetical protein